MERDTARALAIADVGAGVVGTGAVAGAVAGAIAGAIAVDASVGGVAAQQ